MTCSHVPVHDGDSRLRNLAALLALVPLGDRLVIPTDTPSIFKFTDVAEDCANTAALCN